MIATVHIRGGRITVPQFPYSGSPLLHHISPRWISDVVGQLPWFICPEAWGQSLCYGAVWPDCCGADGFLKNNPAPTLVLSVVAVLLLLYIAILLLLYNCCAAGFSPWFVSYCLLSVFLILSAISAEHYGYLQGRLQNAMVVQIKNWILILILTD